MNKCKDCKIYKRAIKENGCCIWYMDNVVCGNESVKNCPQYKKTKGK